MMNRLKYRRDQLIAELQFETSRSSGKGGQHVNKTESRVTVIFDLNQSSVFSDTEKERLTAQLKSRLRQGILRLSSQESRSQFRNKEIVVNRLFELLEQGLVVQKKRKPTTISKGQKEQRIQKKKQQGEKKSLRRKIRKEDY